jgi:hypothetical protein
LSSSGSGEANATREVMPAIVAANSNVAKIALDCPSLIVTDTIATCIRAARRTMPRHIKTPRLRIAKPARRLAGTGPAHSCAVTPGRVTCGARFAFETTRSPANADAMRDTSPGKWAYQCHLPSQGDRHVPHGPHGDSGMSARRHAPLRANFSRCTQLRFTSPAKCQREDEYPGQVRDNERSLN